MAVNIETLNPENIILVESRRVKCDGGDPALGHPVTYYDMADDDYVTCRYCDKVYVLRNGRHDPNILNQD